MNTQPGVAPYKFLVDYQNYPKGEIAGLHITVGDRLAGSTIRSATPTGDAFVTKVCRRATAEDLAAYQEKMRPKARSKPELVPIQFRRPVGQYRGPANGRPGDIAGFPADVARRYVEGYMVGGPNGTRVHSVADYYVDTVAEIDPEPDKPSKRPDKPRRRKRASLDERGAPEQK